MTSPSASPPSPLDVARIAAGRDPVIRNLQITQCYHELAVALTARTGIQANWCTFATWASKQAGQTIRKEDLARILEDILRRRPTSSTLLAEAADSAQALGSPRSQAEIQQAVSEAFGPAAALDRAGDAVARGNRKVFEEIGREFARFLASCLDDLAYDAAKIDSFCAALRPGDPPDGQRYLRQAFTRYYQAFFEDDPKTRAELLLLANIEIGLHEQTRLQPEILEAMDAAIVARRPFQLRMIGALFPYRSWLMRVRLALSVLLNRPGPLTRLLDGLLAEARRQARLLVTAYLLVIRLPEGVRLRLGEDVPGAFPELLQQLDLPDLCGLLAEIDPTPDNPRDSGAVDWADLPDRLHFILEMFRCYHTWAALFEPPFAIDQVADLKAGRLPAGRL